MMRWMTAAAAAAACCAFAGEAQALFLTVAYDWSAPVGVERVAARVCAAEICPVAATSEGGGGGASMIGVPVSRTYLSAEFPGSPPITDRDLWKDLGGGYGGPFLLLPPPDPAEPPRGFLFAAGDTYDGLWTAGNSFAGDPILGYRIDALAGGRAFDVSSPAPGTPGSALGRTFEIAAIDLPQLAPGDRLTVTYANPIGLGGAAPLGDLWGTMTLDFTGMAEGLFGRIAFRADTDAVEGRAAVPAPAAALLLAAAAAALAAAGRRRG